MTDWPQSIDMGDFVRSEYARVVASVAVVTGEHQSAADAVHDVLVQLLSQPPSPAPRNVAAWVTVAARNRARDIRRSRLAEARAYRRLAVDRTRNPDPARPDASARIDMIEAMRRLPARQREICVLRYLADDSVESIARSMGVSEGTVKTQLYRARRTLALQYP